MNPESEVLSTLALLRRRLAGQLLLRQLGRALLWMAALLVLLAVVNHRQPGQSWVVWASFAGALAALFWAGGSAYAGLPDLRQTAAFVDWAAATRDRFSTALEFSRGAQGAFHQRALQECASYLRGRDFAPQLPWCWPREISWLWVPLVALALLHWDDRLAREKQAAAAEAQMAISAPAIAQLQKLAEAVAKGSDSSESAPMKALAERLRQSAERLRAEAQQGSDAERSTLRELSALEEMVRSLQDQRKAQLTPEELQGLAEALTQSEATKEAGAKMQAGDLAASAQSLEAAAQKLAQQGDQRTAEEIQAALKRALEKLSQQRQLSPAAQQMTRQGSPGIAGEQIKRLADLLRQMPAQAAGKPGQPGGQMAPEALQKLLSSLENLKHGEGQSGRSGQQGGDASQILLQAFDRQPTQDLTGGLLAIPTGKAGGEHDTGTTDSPLGAPAEPSVEKGTNVAIAGLLGAGETASQLLPGATSDDSQARRQYRELYQAMAPAAEDAVQQENIPLGARFFVKRYFQAIRPRE